MQIKEIELATGSLHVAEAFYAKVLQLPVVQRLPQRLTFAAGYSLIHFNAGKAPAGAYHFAFLIPPDLLPSAYQWVKDRLPVLPFSDEEDMADFKNWNAKAFYFHDGEQNVVEFIAHYDLEESGADIFSPQLITGVGEIGIPVADVAVACKRLHTIYNIPYYSKGPCLPHFAAMGEEEGLFIVSSIGRGWIPTGQPAISNPLKIRFGRNGEEISVDMDNI